MGKEQNLNINIMSFLQKKGHFYICYEFWARFKIITSKGLEIRYGRINLQTWVWAKKKKR